MDQETTPLLPHSNEASRPLDVYDRFSSAQKRTIVTIISLSGLISPFASGCFVPCVPEVAKDLNTTGTVINFTVGVYILTMAIGTLIWAPYSGFYGRQPIYLLSMPLLIFGSLAVSISATVPQLLAGRMTQAFGASSVMSVGAATISDIYRIEERGTAMGIFTGAVLVGPALAPLMGGLIAAYASWRAMQVFLFGMAVVSFLLIALFLPETSHPGARGIDRALEEEAKLSPNKKKSWRWVWLNPFAALTLLRGPNILFVVFAGSCALMTDIVLLIPMAYTIGPQYGIASPALIGACFLPLGVGNCLGAPMAGRLSDRAVIAGRKRRQGVWVPEDRLIATLAGGLLLTPLSVLVYGLTIQFIPGTLGLVICLVCLFLNGVGVVLVLSPSSTYFVDIVNTRSAEVMAVTCSFRYTVAAIISAGALPAVNFLGVGATNVLAAILAWAAFGLVLITIRYGAKLRAWVDIGYTTSSGQNS